jgi:hypothetical protein
MVDATARTIAAGTAGASAVDAAIADVADATAAGDVAMKPSAARLAPRIPNSNNAPSNPGAARSRPVKLRRWRK